MEKVVFYQTEKVIWLCHTDELNDIVEEHDLKITRQKIAERTQEEVRAF